MTEKIYPPPLIIPRSQHPISRNNIDPHALKVMNRLREAGFTAYLVGGGVRDLYLGKTPKDFDISTDARPGQLRHLFRNSRIIGKRFRLVQVVFGDNKIIEVSTFRQRSEYDLNGKEAVLASNNTFGTPAEDAFRRDLTINALFYEIENGTVIDYIGGVRDLNDRVIRVVGDPDRRFTRDPVRMLRTIRHAARTGFDIEEKTWQAIDRQRESLKLCPESRLRDEILKDLSGGASQSWAELAIKSGLFFIPFPFYESTLSQEDRANPVVSTFLFNILAVIDRLSGAGSKLAEPVLLALVLLPWIDAELELLRHERQGQEAFLFSRKLRAHLDNNLTAFNIKRLTRESIAGLLANLPLFEKHGKDSIWPKWLARKSYFKTGLQYYRIISEARGGERITDSEIIAPAPAKPKPHKKSRRRNNNWSPSIAKKTKGGIFGFKRR